MKPKHITAVRCQCCLRITTDADWTPDDPPPSVTSGWTCPECIKRINEETLKRYREEMKRLKSEGGF